MADPGPRPDPALTAPDTDPSRPTDPTGDTRPAGPAPPADADIPLRPPQGPGEIGRLGGYRVLRLIGRGGMGAVFAAEDVSLRRPVALKTVRPDLARRPEAKARFLREARAAAAAAGDHIVRIYQVGEDAGVPFLAMEYLRGKPLDAWMRENAATLPQVLRIGYEIALGLAAAHALGLVHRDVKPANIWLEAPTGRVKLLDFGLARAVGDDAHLTGSGVIVGTPAYMAPEQARGRPVDHRCDLFSLGSVLYHLTTGRRPFAGNDPLDILSSLAVDVPPPPQALNPLVPPALSTLILRLLAKDPADRPASAAEVAEALRRIRRDPAAAALPCALPAEYAAAGVGTDSATVWEDIAVSSGSAAAPAEPAGPPRAWPVYAVGGAIVALVAVTGGVAVKKLAPQPPEAAEPAGYRGKDPARAGKAAAPAERPRTPSRAGPGELIPPAAAAKPARVFSLDRLDPKAIPAAERVPGQPPELVAVLGSHRRRPFEHDPHLAVSPDGKRVVVGRTLYDADTLRETRLPYPAHAFAPDGRRVAAGDAVWDLADPAKEPVKYPINSDVTQFVTDRIVLARQGEDVIAWRLDEANPRPLAKFPGCGAAAATPDGTLVAVAPRAGGPIELYAVAGDGLTRRGALPGEEGAARAADRPQLLSLAGGRLALIDARGHARVWDVSARDPRLLATESEADGLGNVVLSARGDRLVRWGNREFAVWAVEGEKLRPVARAATPTWVVGTSLSALALSPDATAIVTREQNGAVRFWAVEKDVIVERDPPRPQPTAGAVIVSPDGRTLAGQTENGLVGVWDLSALSGRRLPREETVSGGGMAPAAYSPDGRALAVWADLGRGAFRAWRADAPDPAPLTPPFGGGPARAAYSPDGKSLATLDPSGELVVWDLAGPAPAERFRTRDESPHDAGGRDYQSLAFTPSGQYLVAAGRTPGYSGVVVWAITDRGPVERDRVPFRHLQGGAAVSPDGAAVACSHYDGLDVYDLKAGKLANRRALPEGSAGADFSPDGKTLAARLHGRLCLLDAATLRVTREFQLPGAAAHAAFHPDGRHLIVTNSNHTVYVLRLAAK